MTYNEEFIQKVIETDPNTPSFQYQLRLAMNLLNHLDCIKQGASVTINENRTTCTLCDLNLQ